MPECCGNGAKLVYACSGGADVGEISDRVARRLVKLGYAKPSCLAGVGGHVAGFVASATSGAQNIVIDGCPVACARKTLEHIEAPMAHYVLTEFGLKKGQTPADDALIEKIAHIIMAGTPATTPQAQGSTGGCSCGCS